MRELLIGDIVVDPPVVLAPMAGVTDAPFRVLCAEFGGGLFVNQMVTARALMENHPKSWDLARFHPSESVRSLQLYGTDPHWMGEAVRRLVGEDRVDHIDLNFGCPAPKVTRHGGGAALPVKRRLLTSVIRSAVRAADEESGGAVPVSVKFRMGVDDAHLTYLDTGRISESEGAASVALHARTALDHYGPPARWEAIAELKSAVRSIPVLGNGDVASASDALEMMRATGCDGVVVGRGCLGRPWLFADLQAVLGGHRESEAPNLGEVVAVVRRHLELLAGWESQAHSPAFRKHLGWYLKGYPVGSDVRRAVGQVASFSDVEDLLGRLDPDAPAPPEPATFKRSHSNPLRRVALPDGWLDDPDEVVDGLATSDSGVVISGG